MRAKNRSTAKNATRREFLRWVGGTTAIGVSRTQGFAQSAGPQVLRVVSIPGRMLPVVVGERQGFFSKLGFEVHLDVAPSSDALRRALAARTADMAHAAVDNAVAMVETAGTDVIIVMGGEASANELIAQPEIRSIPQLRGKTLLVDAPDTAYALELKKILRASGLSAGKDYQLLPLGTTPLRLEAMREHKEYAASMLGPPISIVAKQAGFVSLGSTQKLIGPYQATGAFCQRSWAGRHSEDVAKYLAAYVAGQRWLLNAANKSETLELFKQEWRLSDSAAAETYDLIEGRGWFQPDARFDPDGFRTVLELRAEIEGQGKPRAPDSYCDFSYYRRALSRVAQLAQ